MEDAKTKGGKVLVGGGRPSLQGSLSGGSFFEPTVIGEATTNMRIYQEETFGPAIPCFRCSIPGLFTFWRCSTT